MSRRSKKTSYGKELLGGMLLLLFFSCNTVEAITLAPEGYIEYTWEIGEAFVADIWSIIEFILFLF